MSRVWGWSSWGRGEAVRIVVTGGGVMNSITLSDLDKVSGKKTKEISSVLVETTQKMIKKKKKNWDGQHTAHIWNLPKTAVTLWHSLNLLSPNDHKQILQTVLHTFS